MVQVDFDLTPAGVAVFRQAVDEHLVVLLGRVEVGVPQRIPVGIAPRRHRLRVGAAPALQAALLLLRTRVGRGCLGHDRRLEVVGQRDDEIDLANPRRAAHEPLADVRRKPAERREGFGELFSHLERTTEVECIASSETVRPRIAAATAAATVAAPAGV